MTQHLRPGWWFSALAMVACAGANASDVGRGGCASDDRASYICGVHNVEDMLHIEGTPWVLAGRLTAQPAGSGFYLSSIEDKSYSEVKVDFSRSAAGLYPACPGAPRPDQFAAHGIAIRYGGKSQYLPFGHSGGNLDEETVRRWAKRELRNKRITNLSTKFEVTHDEIMGSRS